QRDRRPHRPTDLVPVMGKEKNNSTPDKSTADNAENHNGNAPSGVCRCRAIVLPDPVSRIAGDDPAVNQARQLVIKPLEVSLLHDRSFALITRSSLAGHFRICESKRY